jgi:ketopantoate reductase
MLAASVIVEKVREEGQLAIEYINGEVAQLGREFGLLAPYNEAVVDVVSQAVEAGQRLTPEQASEAIEQKVRPQS